MPSVEELVQEAARRHDRYVEFLRMSTMSAGVYVLPAGAKDRQSPHGEDEIYYVVRGRASFRRGSRQVPVAPGDVLFVPARESHRFVSVREELVLLVVFAPAEGTAPALPS